MIVAPSILSSDFSKIIEELQTIEKASWVHIDVMDGYFVKNITFGPKFIKDIRSHSSKVFDTHLMITEPIRYVKEFCEAGSDYVTIHVEACEDVMKTLQEIKKYNVKCGISIKPNTPVQDIISYLFYVDLVLVMSVEPGFGGQKFMDSALQKIELLNELKQKNGYHYLIEVDGGINLDTAKKCKNAGVDCVVAGSYIFKNKDRNQVITDLKSI